MRAAGNLPGRIHALFDVDSEREEVRAFARLHPALCRRQDHRVAGADDDGAIRLLRQLSGFERNLAPADRHADVGLALSGNCHQFFLHSALRESGDSSQRR
jgi:hypothetical protein